MRSRARPEFPFLETARTPLPHGDGMKRLSTLARTILMTLAVVATGCSHAAPASSPTTTVPAPAAERSISITDGESLIRAMHQRYASTWYHTATFTQRTTITRGQQSPIVQTWYEALSLPGKLRIDVGNPDGGNGTLFRNDSTYFMSAGRIARADTGFNELLVLGFDVYTQPPEQTISILRHLGYQLSRLHSNDLNGRSVYVVGATSKYDSTSKQFWIERDRLLFVRGEEKTSSGQQNDVRFMDYVPAGTGWMARQVWQYIGGSPRLHEEYSGIKTDVVLDPNLFEPKLWSTATHWLKP